MLEPYLKPKFNECFIYIASLFCCNFNEEETHTHSWIQAQSPYWTVQICWWQQSNISSFLSNLSNLILIFVSCMACRFSLCLAKTLGPVSVRKHQTWPSDREFFKRHIKDAYVAWWLGKVPVFSSPFPECAVHIFAFISSLPTSDYSSN